jgi:bifunctional non-homologous end joining protein LigD
VCVFDLDPSRDDEPDVLRSTALGVRQLLAEIELTSWVKTSGSKGFHIVVPLDAKGAVRRGVAVCARGGQGSDRAPP